jgi:hypothetical protein
MQSDFDQNVVSSETNAATDARPCLVATIVDTKPLLSLNLFLLYLWAALTIALPIIGSQVPLSLAVQYVLGLTPIAAGSIYGTPVANILSFSALFIPRFVMILLLIAYLRKDREASYEIGTPALFIVLWLISVPLKLYYVSTAVMLLTSGYLGAKAQEKSWSLAWFIVVLAAYFGVLHFFSVSRGSFVLVVIPVCVGLMSRPKWQLGLAGMLGLGVLVAQTLAKFQTSDMERGLNIIYRISSYGQYIAYATARHSLFSPGHPAFVEAFLSLPLIRNFGTTLNEIVLHIMFTGGKEGGFAVSPELRSMSYWGSYAEALVDLTVVYLLLYLTIRLACSAFPRVRSGVVLALPILIQMDSMDSLPYFLQTVIAICLITFFLRMPSRPLVVRGLP